MAEPAPHHAFSRQDLNPHCILALKDMEVEVLKHQLCLVFSIPQIPFLPPRHTVLLLEVYMFDLDFLTYYEIQISTLGDGLLKVVNFFMKFTKHRNNDI